MRQICPQIGKWRREKRKGVANLLSAF